MSDTVKIILIIAVFAFFMYRKKFSAFLSKRKNEHTAEKGTVNNQSTSSSAIFENNLSRDISGSLNDTNGISERQNSAPWCYEIYAFDYAQYPETEHFADRINAKLDLIEISMQNKRHYIKFIELGTCLLVLVKYQN